MKRTNIAPEDIEIENIYDVKELPSLHLKQGLDLSWDLELGGSSSCVNLRFKVSEQKHTLGAFKDNREGDSEDIFLELIFNLDDIIEVCDEEYPTPLFPTDIAPKKISFNIEEVEKVEYDTYRAKARKVKVYF